MTKRLSNREKIQRAKAKPKPLRRQHEPKPKPKPKKFDYAARKSNKNKVNKLPFGKRSHIIAVKMIAEGLQSVGKLTTYLELGTAKGACFNQVAPLAEVAHAVDHDPYKYDHVQQNKNLRWHPYTTDHFLLGYSGDKFDLVFIDAGHTFQSSWDDFQLVAPLVKDDGIILLHDTYPPNEDFAQPGLSGDTWKTAWKIRQELSSEYEIVTLPFYFGISIVRKCRKQLAWAEEEK